MIWVDREAKKIKETKGNTHQHVDDMKTPSGRVHVGALRGVLIHDIVHKALVDQGVSSEYTYVFNDLDQMDAIPSYLDKEIWEKYSGMPLCNIPSPVEGYENFAQYYAQEFVKAFETINCHPEVIWSSQLYRSGKMNDVIKEGLDNAAVIRKQYEEIAKAPKKDNWYPYQVICEKCGKSGTTTVTDWDGELVSYMCEENKAKWANGCGHTGKTSPFNGNGKFLWKVDWAAHWKVLGVTIESSGKDHMSKGGSYDLSSGIAEHAFHYTPPNSLGGYEWFTIGGTKMSSSKGIGTSAIEAATELLPPELLRFLLVRTPIERAIDFNPYGDTIPNLFDDYDRCMSAYYDKEEAKLPDGKQGEVLSDFARIYELSQIKQIAKNRMYVPRFRTIVNILRSHKDVITYCEDQVKRPLSQDEKELIKERIKYVERYLIKYVASPQTIHQTNPINNHSLNNIQKKFLREIAVELADKKSTDRDEIQEIVFSTIKKGDYNPKESFKALYLTLTGKEFGPKIADLILNMGVANVLTSIQKSL